MRGDGQRLRSNSGKAVRPGISTHPNRVVPYTTENKRPMLCMGTATDFHTPCDSCCVPVPEHQHSRSLDRGRHSQFMQTNATSIMLRGSEQPGNVYRLSPGLAVKTRLSRLLPLGRRSRLERSIFRTHFNAAKGTLVTPERSNKCMHGLGTGIAYLVVFIRNTPILQRHYAL